MSSLSEIESQIAYHRSQLATFERNRYNADMQDAKSQSQYDRKIALHTRAIQNLEEQKTKLISSSSASAGPVSSTCPMCNGTRFVLAAGKMRRPCPRCGGTGRV